MVEAKYFRDYRHSYMILTCRQEGADRNYQYKILTSDKLKEILKCSLRHVNGITYFYYDISSRTTLESLYRGRKMTFAQVKDLFGQLYGIYTKLGAYFMEESKLVLLPEYIYYDLSDQKYVGLYYPDYEPEVANPYEALMDYLLEHIDGKDDRLADCMYRIYEMSEEAYFSLEDALQMLGDSEEKETAIMESEAWTVKEDMPLSTIPRTEVKYDDLYEFGQEKTTSTQKKKSPFYSILAVGSVLGIAGAMGIYYLYELSQEEILILFGCVGLMGLCLVVSVAGSLKAGNQRSVKDDMKYKSPGSQESGEVRTEILAETALPEGKIVPLENVLSKDMDLSMAHPARQTIGEAPEKEDWCSNTVFFDSSRMAEHKLYALDKKNKQHIELTKFPYTIGKMAGCVDCVLTDDSISRIHARFEKMGDSIQMTDMNSTNGTFRNGLRLQPQETVEIEPGDEIRFGNLRYCYR